MHEGDSEQLGDYLARLPRETRGTLIDELLSASLAVQMATRCLEGRDPRPNSVRQLRSYLDRGIRHLQTVRDSLPA
jgi:hypothetical protein